MDRYLPSTPRACIEDVNSTMDSFCPNQVAGLCLITPQCYADSQCQLVRGNGEGCQLKSLVMHVHQEEQVGPWRHSIFPELQSNHHFQRQIMLSFSF